MSDGVPSDSLRIGERDFIRATEAARVVGYTQDYITRLAREGKIEGARVARQWFVSLESAQKFVTKVAEEKDARRVALRLERKQERIGYEQVSTGVVQQRAQAVQPTVEQGANVPVYVHRPLSAQRVHMQATSALLQTAVIVVLGLSVGSFGYLTISSQSFSAAVHYTNLTIFERLALSVYDFVSGKQTSDVAVVQINSRGVNKDSATGIEEDVVSAQSVGGGEGMFSAQETSTRRALFVAPEDTELAEQIDFILDSFSDEVVIIFDAGRGDTGVLVPQFRDGSGEAYRFLMAPVVPGSELSG